MSEVKKIGTFQADGKAVELLSAQQADGRWVVVLNEPSSIGEEGAAVWEGLQGLPSEPTFGAIKQAVAQRLSNPDLQFARDQPFRQEPVEGPAPEPTPEPEAPADEEVVEPTELDPVEEVEPAEDKSEADHIRDYLEANPEATNKDVIAALAEQGVKVSSSQVSRAKRS